MVKVGQGGSSSSDCIVRNAAPSKSGTMPDVRNLMVGGGRRLLIIFFCSKFLLYHDFEIPHDFCHIFQLFAIVATLTFVVLSFLVFHSALTIEEHHNK